MSEEPNVLHQIDIEYCVMNSNGAVVGNYDAWHAEEKALELNKLRVAGEKMGGHPFSVKARKVITTDWVEPWELEAE